MPLPLSRGRVLDSSLRPADLAPLLNVDDVARSIAFYDVRGYEVLAAADDGGVPIWANLGDAAGRRLMLNHKGVIGADERQARPHYADVVLYLTYPNVTLIREKLLAAGLEVTPIERQAYGVDECWTRDSDGYELALASYFQTDSGD